MQIEHSSFYSFVKLSEQQRRRLLKEKGTLLDTENNADNIVKLYFLDGFYVEEIIPLNSPGTSEIVPFKRGYKLESYRATESDNSSIKPNSSKKFLFLA